MDETVFGNEEDDVVFLAYLHCDWEIIHVFGREEYIDCTLLENGSSFFVVDFDDVELALA